jgi:anti-sigma factor RsiW
MSTLCETIETLAMVYLDDELDAAERRELELHVHDCRSCRDHIATERTSRVKLRALLAPPPASALLRTRIGHALAAEDRAMASAARRGALGRWLLPGVAAAAAAAALVVFVASTPQEGPPGGAVARAAMKVQSRPLAVQGASAGPGPAQPFAADVAIPAFTADDAVRVVGARRIKITGYDAAQVFYEVVAGSARFELSLFKLEGVRTGDLRGTRRVVVNGNELWVSEADGPTGRTAVVSYEDQDHNGYVFMSQAFGAQALLDVVIGSDLIRRGERIR